MGKSHKHRRTRKSPQSQVVAVYVPRRDPAPSKSSRYNAKKMESKTFKHAFLQTLDGVGNGLLMSHLYHEPTHAPERQEQGSAYSSLKQRFNRLLYGGYAWDEFVKAGGSYDLQDSDLTALDFAVRDGLVQNLPDRIKMIEYGPGGKSGVGKPAQLIKAIMQSNPAKITSYIAVDILNRFATESALEIHEEFNLRSFAVVGDFSAREKLAIPNVAHTVPMVVSFGGGFANAPDYSPSQGKNGKDNASTYFAQMNRQYGLGSYLLMSYHCERDPEKLLREYERTDVLEAFIMSAFVRAVSEGLITNVNYDPFAYWRIEPSYDDKIHAIVENAVCLNTHTLTTTDGDYHFKTGDSLPMTLSHKWDEEDYKGILNNAGYALVKDKSYRAESLPRGILLARAVHAPKCAP